MGKDPDIYVEIINMTSMKTEFDPSLKSSMPKLMCAAAKDYLKSASGFTTKGDKGYGVSGTLATLKKDKKNNEDVVACVVNMIVSEYPEQKMAAANLQGTAFYPLSSNEKKHKKDAETCVAGAVEAGLERALKHIKSLK